MKILGIESSCDETACAVLNIEDGKFDVLSNEVASQIDIHSKFGGVVPEIASRAHCEAISSLTYKALEDANVTLKDIDAVCVTAYPGLIGALLVGVNFAKGLAFANNIPLYAVDHIKGHIASAYLSNDLKPPFIAFVASGGHTSIVHVKDYVTHTVIGGTRDDAVGEAFDKVARVMGMPYPGGAAMDKISYNDEEPIKFPSASIKGDTLEFSFSGIKTSVLNYLNSVKQSGLDVNVKAVAKGFTKSVTDSIVNKMSLALDMYPDIKSVAFVGGVAANSHIRKGLRELCEKRQVNFYVPELKYCGDNGAMIACAGYYEILYGNPSDLNLNADASKFEDKT